MLIWSVRTSPRSLAVALIDCGTGVTLRNHRREGAAPRLTLSGFAPLAQLAEHFHGKEGVYGSSP